jgi:superfamily II DNA or RNA helicase
VPLRPYQEDCVQIAYSKREAGLRRMVACMATGLGKSRVLAEVIARSTPGGQSIAVAHRMELIDQLAEEVALWNPKKSIGVEMGARKADGREDIIVGSVQTLSKMSRLEKINPFKVEWLIYDECHHANAPSYGLIADYIMANPAATLYGTTATVNRADGQGLGRMFDEVVYQYDILKGIEHGWLSDVHGFMLKSGTDISAVRAHDGDFTEKGISSAVNTPERNELIVKGWIEYLWPRQTMVFTVNVAHARDICAAFQRQGIRAAYSWGEDKERRAKLALFTSGQLDVLINCQLWIEGFNYRMVEAIIPATPTKSQPKLIQMVGRGTRLDPRIDNLVDFRNGGLLTDDHKQNVLVMDVLDVLGRHSLATVPSLFGLSPKLDLEGSSVVAAIKAINKAQAAHPNVDMGQLEQLSNLETHIQEANLWQVKFAEDIKGFSELQWTKRGDNSYRLLLPNNEYVRVSEDLVGKFVVEGVINNQPMSETKIASLAEAVGLAEREVSSRTPQHMILLGREQKWQRQPVTGNQMKLLRRLRVPDSQIVQMTRGQASAYLNQRLNTRAKD